MGNETQSTEGSLGLGLDAAQEAEVMETIGVMIGLQVLMDNQEEEADLFSDENSV